MTEAPVAAPAWTDADLANPHAVRDKARRVEAMFAAIAPSYDLNNRVHSLGRDQAWRRAAVRLAGVRPGETVLDAACGTGDLSLAFAAAGARRVVGIDFTFNMLAVAARKDARAGGPAPAYSAGDAMRLPVDDASVDVVSIAFGIRNVADPAAALREFFRVLRPGGRLVILEFSLPRSAALRGIYNVYFKHVMPRTASLIARDRSGAYRYLPQSVSTFIDRPAMLELMRSAGFTELTLKPLTLGIAVIYRGVRSGQR
jgi:demethylmenaquinone methyltransferase/2-methoxy-6-polyprenyl-1,4-benzoquinol methylase